MTTNWTLVERTLGSDLDRFALGELSGRQLMNLVRHENVEVRSEVRNLLRNRNVTYARRLARKALRRRDLL